MVRKLIPAVVVLAFAGTAWADYEEVRELSLDSHRIDTLRIEAGAGTLDVVGVAGITEITVVATIEIPAMYQGSERPPRKYSLNVVFLLRPKYRPMTMVNRSSPTRTTISSLESDMLLFSALGEEAAHDFTAFFFEHPLDNLSFGM